MMKTHNLTFSHKNKLTISTRPKKQVQPFIANIQVCSIVTPNIIARKGNSYTSLEKENKKQIPLTKPKNMKSSIKDSLKLRSYSTHSALKPSHNSLSKLQYGQKQAKQPNKEKIIEDPVQEIIYLLKKNFILAQNQSNNYTIKKESFFNLLNYLLFKDDDTNSLTNSHKFDYLSTYLAQISRNIADKQALARKEKLKIASKVTKYVFNIDKYRSDIQKKTTELEDLDLKKQSLVKVINELEELAPALAKQYLNTQEEINQDSRMLESMKADIASLKVDKENLCKQIERHKKQFEQVKQASQKIGSYVNSQNNKLIILASQEYKEIESDIYDYASYLQCNQLASSLTYEPLSVTCLTNQLEDQLREINRTLVQNESIDPKDKGKAMRDFLLEWINRFKKKDQEQKEIIKFKTKCVHNFIEKMKKWLDNWTLKQQYLVGLRDEFSMDTTALKNLISEFTTAEKLCQPCLSIVQPLINNISVLYEKIETNYKLGNSFY